MGNSSPDLNCMISFQKLERWVCCWHVVNSTGYEKENMEMESHEFDIKPTEQ